MKRNKDHIPNPVQFLFGGLAGMGATCINHPMDLLKTRFQLTGMGSGVKEYKTSFHAVSTIIRNEGFLALYNGLSAGLFRQATYTTTRIGIFTTLIETLSGAEGQPPAFMIKILVGICAGGVAGIVGTPSEVALIRMMGDGRLPPSERRNYSNALNALVRITREEGVMTLFRGMLPTIGRSIVGSTAQLVSYSQSKEILLSSTEYFEDNSFLHLVASMISGLVTTVASLPLDIAKTRIQYMKMVDGKRVYKGTTDVLIKVIRIEGFHALWKGFTPFYARVGPHTVFTFMFLEQLNALYKKFNF